MKLKMKMIGPALSKRQKVIRKWPIGSSLTKFFFTNFLQRHCRVSIAFTLSLLFWTNFPATYDFYPPPEEIIMKSKLVVSAWPAK